MLRFLLGTAAIALILYSIAFIVNACILVDFYSGGDYGCRIIF